MNTRQQKTLEEIIEEYFKGGNSRNDSNDLVLKRKLEVIRDFVKENFK